MQVFLVTSDIYVSACLDDRIRILRHSHNYQWPGELRLVNEADNQFLRGGTIFSTLICMSSIAVSF